eukprot:1494776-Heterocapsa_arctica.AAC.1
MTERAMQWAYGAGPKSHLHLMNDEEGLVTACGRTLRLPDVGLGLNQALSTGKLWSPRCFKRLNPVVQDAWQQAQGANRS